MKLSTLYSINFYNTYKDWKNDTNPMKQKFCNTYLTTRHILSSLQLPLPKDVESILEDKLKQEVLELERIYKHITKLTY